MSSGGVGDTDGYTIITDVRQIDFNDEAAVMAEIEQFAETYAYADIEHALVITPAGKVYSLRGNDVVVNPNIINHEELFRSIVVHNHPVEWADSFSPQDFALFFERGLLREDVIFGNQHNIMRYDGIVIDSSVARELYRNAFQEVRQNAMQTQIPLELEQLETMRQLSKTMKGLVFIENPR